MRVIFSPPTFFLKNLLTCLQEATNSCLLLRILPSPLPSRIANFSLGQRLHLSPLPTNTHYLMMISQLQCGVWIYLLLLLLLVGCRESNRIFIFGIGQDHLMISKNLLFPLPFSSPNLGLLTPTPNNCLGGHLFFFFSFLSKLTPLLVTADALPVNAG